MPSQKTGPPRVFPFRADKDHTVGNARQKIISEGGKVEISFTSVGKGLMTGRKSLHWGTKPVNEELQGFQICGKDRQWKWAKAEIKGPDTVVVWHPEIKAPDEVRYAWAQNPAKANLYNKAGLPTSVFSTKE